MPDRRKNEVRRKSTERRRLRERLRHANTYFVVVEVEATDLRVVTLERTPGDEPDRVRSASLQWRHEAPSLSSQVGVEEFTVALKKIAEQQDLYGAQVQFVLGGEFCVTRAMRGSNEEVQNELQQLEHRSRLYLMLGPGEKVMVSSSKQIDARHKYTVAAVCNKKTLDVIREATLNAGMQIRSIEPALVSTSRVIGRLKDAPTEPCLLINIDNNSIELGVCHDGQLLLDYRPAGHTGANEILEVVRTHLSRLQRHVGRQLHEPPPTLRRIYLSGEEKLVESALHAFTACEEFDVEKISPEKVQATWYFEDCVADSSVAPALGSLLSSYLPSSERDAPDFMEHIVASARTPLRPVLIRSAMPLAAVLLVAFTMLFVNHRQQLVLDQLQQQVDSLAPARARALELRLKFTSMDSKLSQLKILASGMQVWSQSDAIARIGHCMPSDVWLSKMTIDDMQAVQLSGASYLEAGVFDFTRWLEQAPGFRDVALQGTRAGQSPSGPVINFNVELNLSDIGDSVEEVARNE